MKLSTQMMLCLTIAALGLSSTTGKSDDTKGSGKSAVSEEDYPASMEEARGRARWMHEAIHGSLQVMHRDFFGNGDDNLSLPSQSLEDVFLQLDESWGVEARWLGVNATKDADHEPQDAFEKKAAKAIAAGETEFFAVERGKFRYVGMIRLKNECLKCHVPRRTTLEDRFAGLALSIPLKKVPPTDNQQEQK